MKPASRLSPRNEQSVALRYSQPEYARLLVEAQGKEGSVPMR
jgi:hypothetical protein